GAHVAGGGLDLVRRGLGQCNVRVDVSHRFHSPHRPSARKNRPPKASSWNFSGFTLPLPGGSYNGPPLCTAMKWSAVFACGRPLSCICPIANAPLSRVFGFGPRVGPLVPFSFSPQTRGMERREAPGALRSAPQASLAIGWLSRRASGTHVL